MYPIGNLSYALDMCIRNVGMLSTWLLSGLVGCGTVNTNVNTDAGNTTADASTADATVPDAQAKGTITVKVMIGGSPAEGIPVFSHDVDGSYIASVLTNASGEVTIEDFPAGGAVTAPVGPFVDEFNANNQLISITDVQLGDVLTLGNSVFFPNQGGSRIGTASINPPSTTVANATRYKVYVPCRNGTVTTGTALSLNLREGCVKPNNTIDAIAIAEDANGVRLAYSTRTGIPVTGVAPNKTASASLNGWNTDWASLRLNLQNAPFDNLDPEGIFQGYRQGLLLDDEGFNNLAQPLNMGEQDFFLRKSVPNFVNDATYIVAMQPPKTGGGEATTILSTREQLSFNPGTSLVRNIDLSTDILPVIENISVTGDSSVAVTWSTAGNAVGCKASTMPDSLVTMVHGTSGPDDYVWFVLSPGSSSQRVSFPRIDPALAQTIWPIATFTQVNGGVAVFSDSAQTWDEIRRADNNLSYFNFIPLPDSTRCISAGGTLTVN